MRNPGKYLLAASVVMAVLVGAPLALGAGEGRPLDGGARNPSDDARQNYTRETEIIADVPTYATRQSNKSATGGGATYGCRATATASRACVRASNLADGLAFSFAGKGATVGRIEATTATARPFTTNATGVATGLNADRIDGLDGGQVAPRLARVQANGILAGGRGAITAARTAEGLYTVRFNDDITNCNYSGQQVETGDNAGATLIELVDANTLRVRTRNGGGQDGTGANANGDHPFHVQVFC
jgi:hypothetical protein